MLLGIDYGTTTTRAVLAGPDRRWSRVLFDGAPRLPSGVYLAPDGTLIPGEAGWRQALDDPGRYVAHPLTHLTAEMVEVAGHRLDPIDLVAAALRAVGEAATHQAGGPPTQVRLVIPASWGPRRQTLLRRAVIRAGLPQPHLIAAPIAVAAGIAHTSTAIPTGGSILVANLGAGRFEATIVQHTADGFEVVSTIDNTAAGASAIDTALANHIATLTAALPHPEPPPGGSGHGSLRALAAITAAKEALGHSPALAVPTPHGLPIVVDQPTLHSLAQPILDKAAATSRQAIAAADLTPAQLAGVYCIGGGARLPAAIRTLHDGLGIAPTVTPDPDWAAVLGAVDATGTTPGPPIHAAPVGRPRLRHYTAAVIPALAVPVLLLQTIAGALPVHVADITSPIGSVITNWGGYAMIGLLATQAALATATIVAAYLHDDTPSTDPNAVTMPRLAARLLPAAALTGLTAAGLTAVIAALWHGVPDGPFLRWSLLPALPVAAAATVVGILAARRPAPPGTTWVDWLTTPATAISAAAAAMLLVQFGHTNTDPRLAHAALPATILGALLFGAATTLALPLGRAWRLTAAAPLTLVTVILTLGYATGTLAAVYALAVTAWWLGRATRLALPYHPLTAKPPPQPVANHPGSTESTQPADNQHGF